MISKYISDKCHSDWDKSLDLFAFAHNTSIHSTTRYSPFFLLHGFEPIVPSDLITSVVYRNQTTIPPLQLSSLRTWIRDYIRMAQDSMKSRFDAKHPLLEFVPGDIVLVKRPNSGPGLATKLLPKKILAFIVTRLNSNNYKIQFHHSDRFDVVHVQHLSPFRRRFKVSFSTQHLDSARSLPPSPYAEPERSCLTTRPHPDPQLPSSELISNVPPKPSPRFVYFEPCVPIGPPASTSLPQANIVPSPSRIPIPIRHPSLRPRDVLNLPARYRT
jgi:hypothetical protein